MSFFVWPREAALLGCALQEYLGAWDYGEKPCFLEIITKRLRPFYPPAGRILSGMVKEDDLPKDIAWDAVPGFLRAGFAPSVPESWFVGAGQAQLRPDDAAECPPGEDAALCPLHDDAFLSVAIEAMARRRLAIRSTRTDPTARNLLDLIVELVAPHLARSPKDDAAFNLTREDAPWGLL